MIKTIIFDNNGVLVTSNKETGFGAISKLTGLSEDIIAPIYSKFASGADEGKYPQSKQFELFVEELGLEADPKLLQTAVYDSFVTKEDVLAFVAELKPTFDLAILTNFGDDYWKLNDRWKLERFFDKSKVFVSCELGMRKPHKEIYEYVLSKLNVEPHETIFIDDGAPNVKAATKLGMHGIVFTSPEQFKNELQSILDKENENGKE